MFTTKLNVVALLAFAVLCVMAASEAALAASILFRLLSLVLACPL